MTETRAAALEQLASRRFDLLVVGGGIIGAGIAELAARHGLAVALVEKGDFASGTSSASSKLIHGGLRYLRTGQFALVREALGEVRALSDVVAPHLVRRLRFVLPIYRGGPYGRVPIRGALWSYAGLAGATSERGRMISPRAAAELVPSLRRADLRAAGLYADAQTDDARLCLAVLRGAADNGAVVLNRAELVGLAPTVVVEIDGRTVEVHAGAIVNATGPWVDEVRRLEDLSAGTSVTLSRGAHVVVDQPAEWDAALTIPVDRTRVSFAIPWAGKLLLGTTDTPYEGDPGSLEATDEDERQIRAEAAGAVDGLGPTLARFAGARVLPVGALETARAPRETVFSRGRLGMLSVAGGKLTTYRRIALAVLHALRAELDLHRIDRIPRPLPGAGDPEVLAAALARRHAIDPELAGQLAARYGTLAGEVLAGDDDLLAAQVAYAREREWAQTADDFLRRRTTLALTGEDTPELRARVEELLRR